MDYWVFLIKVYNEIEGDIIINLLESNGIEVKKSYPKDGVFSRVILGSAMEIDIYVRKDEYQNAKTLLPLEEN